MIFFGPRGHKARGIRVSYQTKGLPRDTKSTFHLWAYGDVFHIAAQGIGKKSVELVSPIVADLFTQEAFANSQFDRLFHEISLSSGLPNHLQTHGIHSICIVYMSQSKVSLSEFLPLTLSCNAKEIKDE
jgi:hypothetical protein